MTAAPGADAELVARFNLRLAELFSTARNFMPTLAVRNLPELGPEDGLPLARHTLATPAVSPSFEELWAANCLEFTVEWLVTQSQYARLFTAAEVAWATRPRTGSGAKAGAAVIACAVVIAGVAPLGIAADYVWQTDRAVDKVFSDDQAVVAVPGTIDTTTVPASPTTSTTSTSSTSSTSTLPPAPGTDRVNVLLLGGDAGPGRWSLRTDSMVVVSINPDTGDTAMISVPRNLYHLPFPPGSVLADTFPDGFTDLANAVYPYVNERPELVGGVADAGAQAIKMGIAQFLGIPINYYVLVDMAGFVDVIDALGGIDINVNKRVPTPGNPRGSKHPVPEYISVGPQHMDGTIALAYARSREADSDYSRMARQRCVLTGIADAATPRALATGLGDLVSAFGEAVRTDIPRSELGNLTELISAFQSAGGLETARTLQFTPPVIEPGRWDPEVVRQKVIEVITPPAFGGVWNGPVLASACS